MNSYCVGGESTDIMLPVAQLVCIVVLWGMSMINISIITVLINGGGLQTKHLFEAFRVYYSTLSY